MNSCSFLRLLVPLCFALAHTTAHADRTITMPIGRTLLKGSLRIERDWGVSRKAEQLSFAAFTPIRGLEFEFRSIRTLTASQVDTLDVQYNINPPLTSLAPGISVGVLDIYDRTPEKRRGFWAVTFREQVDVGAAGDTADASIGYQFGGARRDLFIGVSLPVMASARLLVEHDGQRLAAGFSVHNLPGLEARVFDRQGITMAGLRYSIRF